MSPTKVGENSEGIFGDEITKKIRTGKINASTRRLLPAAMLERWPKVCRFKITLTLLRTNRFVSTTNSM